MSIWNREYMRADVGLRGAPGWGAVSAIIAINVALFFASFLVESGLVRSLSFSVVKNSFVTSWSIVAHEHKIWTILTSAFYHQDLIHLLFNMLALYVLGRGIESRLGKQRFVAFYLASCIAASLLHVLSGAANDNWNRPMLGASGAVSAVAMLFALWNPHARFLLFFVIPMPAIAVVAVLVFMDVAGMLVQGFGGFSDLGHGAHLGGAAFGFGWWYAAKRGFGIRVPWPRWGRRRRRRKFRVVDRDAPPPEDKKELDRILSKISREGMEKLGMSEREFLDKVSRRYRGEQ